MALLLAAAAGCSAGPIAWEDTTVTAANAPAAAVAGVPHSAGQCTLSVRTAVDASGTRHAVWWQLRADRTADLVTARSADGRTWSAPLRIDTLDAGRVGCFRAPPAITADGSNIHVVYAMHAREGPGIFLTHSMDGGGLYHSPSTVVYGPKPGRADVAASGNLVLVAYEDPNTSPTRISVAISTTMAHLFEYRQVVSPPGVALTLPRVAIEGRRVTVTWARTLLDSSAARSGRAGVVR